MIRFPKIRLFIGCCLLLVLFNSCRPRGVLSRKEMASVLFEIHLTEAAVYDTAPQEWTHGLPTNYFRDMAYRSVLRKHHLTQGKFYESVSWYSKHMGQYEKVYVNVQKQMDDFKAAVDQGQFEQAGSWTIQNMDTAKIRSIYTFGLFRPDTISLHSLFLRGHSLSFSSTWYASQWMYPMAKDTARLMLYPTVAIDSMYHASKLDSLKVKAESPLKQINPTPSSNNGREVLAPGARRLPTRNFREVPKSEQIRRRFEQRAVDQERLKRQEAEQQRREKMEASKTFEPKHWK